MSPGRRLAIGNLYSEKGFVRGYRADESNYSEVINAVAEQVPKPSVLNGSDTVGVPQAAVNSTFNLPLYTERSLGSNVGLGAEGSVRQQDRVDCLAVSQSGGQKQGSC